MDRSVTVEEMTYIHCCRFLLLLISLWSATALSEAAHRPLGNKKGAAVRLRRSTRTRRHLGFYASHAPLVMEYGGGSSSNDVPEFLTINSSEFNLVQFYAGGDCELCAHMVEQYARLAYTLQRQVPANITFAAHAIDCARFPELCQAQGVARYPTVRTYKPKDAMGASVSLQHLHPFEILESLGLSSSEDENDSESSEVLWEMNTGNHHVLLSNQHRRRSRQQLQNDLLLAVDHTLRHSIYKKSSSSSSSDQPLSPTRSDELHAWLHLLHKTVSHHGALQALLRDLVDNFMYVSKSRDYLVAVLDEHASPAEERSWSPLVCGGGDHPEDENRMSSYECSFWDLMLSVVTGWVDYNAMSFVTEERLNTSRVVTVLQQFVQDFAVEIDSSSILASAHFGNVTTKTHEDESAMEERQLPIWLAETRSKSLRHQASSGDDNKLDVVWPSRLQCPVCRTADGTARDSDLLYKYLFVEYGPRTSDKFLPFQRDLHDALVQRMEDDLRRRRRARTDRIQQQGSCLVAVLAILGWRVVGMLRRRRSRRSVMCAEQGGCLSFHIKCE